MKRSPPGRAARVAPRAVGLRGRHPLGRRVHLHPGLLDLPAGLADRRGGRRVVARLEARQESLEAGAQRVRLAAKLPLLLGRLGRVAPLAGLRRPLLFGAPQRLGVGGEGLHRPLERRPLEQLRAALELAPQFLLLVRQVA